jgi:hypothetical protein
MKKETKIYSIDLLKALRTLGITVQAWENEKKKAVKEIKDKRVFTVLLKKKLEELEKDGL